MKKKCESDRDIRKNAGVDTSAKPLKMGKNV